MPDAPYSSRPIGSKTQTSVSTVFAIHPTDKNIQARVSDIVQLSVDVVQPSITTLQTEVTTLHTDVNELTVVAEDHEIRITALENEEPPVTVQECVLYPDYENLVKLFSDFRTYYVDNIHYYAIDYFSDPVDLKSNIEADISFITNLFLGINSVDTYTPVLDTPGLIGAQKTTLMEYKADIDISFQSALAIVDNIILGYTAFNSTNQQQILDLVTAGFNVVDLIDTFLIEELTLCPIVTDPLVKKAICRLGDLHNKVTVQALESLIIRETQMSIALSNLKDELVSADTNVVSGYFYNTTNDLMYINSLGLSALVPSTDGEIAVTMKVTESYGQEIIYFDELLFLNGGDKFKALDRSEIQNHIETKIANGDTYLEDIYLLVEEDNAKYVAIPERAKVEFIFTSVGTRAKGVVVNLGFIKPINLTKLDRENIDPSVPNYNDYNGLFTSDVCSFNGCGFNGCGAGN